ncbi:MAG: PepSY domain-containing protein, partial [Pseudomonadota bacterium]
MKLKRYLYLIHRWLGIGMCLLMAMWFMSGVVLMYVHFPTLTPAERLAGLPALDVAKARHTPDILLSKTPQRSLTLTTVAGRPAWLAQSVAGTWNGLFADTGESVAGLEAARAKAAARDFMAARGRENASIGVVDLIEMDQWTVSSSLHAHRPLFEVPINDASGTVLYVSSRTGQVVRDTTRSERVWNWLGANLHWIYPLALRRHAEVWHWVVVALSLIGLVSIVTGAVIGVLRLRLKHPYRGRDRTPYRGLMKWHHVLGLVCSLFLCTFMLSGLLSMNPWGVFTSSVDYSTLPLHYQGAAPGRLEPLHLEKLQEKLRIDPGVKEVRW